jgi:AmmeMemoRadiSam system protein A
MQPETRFLDSAAKDLLLNIARASLERFVRQGEQYRPQLIGLPEALQQAGNSFVTLTYNGKLRGCIGHTEAQYPIAEDVAQNAAAASRDLRFSPVTAEELFEIRLEITLLNAFNRLTFANYGELTSKIMPGIDGVMIVAGAQQALLLPQVWQRIPDTNQFLGILANKAGIPRANLKVSPPLLDVYTFKAHHYAEAGYQEPTG